jgi:phage terminase large subunit-like protein
MAALLPTLQARPNPQIWYTSSAGMENSEQLRKVRIRGRRGDPRLRYFEWSCPEDVDLDSVEAWAQANPAMGLRLRSEGIASLRSAMSDDTFGREILGIWSEDNQQTMIDLRLWAACGDRNSRPGNQLVFAVDVKPDRTAACIASAGRRDDGRLHTKLVDHREGVDWVVDRVHDLKQKYNPRAIVIDPAGPAGSLIADFADLGIEPELVTGRELAQACGAFHNDVLNDRLRHADQDSLTAALRQATTRNLGDAWAWDRRDSRGDICPLVAATLATHGFRLHGNEEAPRPWVMFG